MSVTEHTINQMGAQSTASWLFKSSGHRCSGEDMINTTKQERSCLESDSFHTNGKSRWRFLHTSHCLREHVPVTQMLGEMHHGV